MVYSPIGGVGKTSASLALCHQLSLLNKNVLYINASDIQTHHIYLKKDGFAENSFERMFRAKDKNILNILETAVWHMEFDCLKPFYGTKTSYDIGIENYLYLLNEIKEKGMYDFVIVDVDSSFDKFNGELMTKSDKILIIVNSSRYDYESLKIFLNYVKNTEKEKMIFVSNKYSNIVFDFFDYSFVEYIPQLTIQEESYLQELYRIDAMKDTALLLL